MSLTEEDSIQAIHEEEGQNLTAKLKRHGGKKQGGSNESTHNQVQKEDKMKHVSKIGIMLCIVAIAATTIIAGCSSTPLRTEALKSGIRSAEEAGAANVPQASLYLQLAKEELELAKKLAAKGDKEEAESMLKRAESDAELAAVLSHEEAEKAEAMKAVERARQLRQDNQ